MWKLLTAVLLLLYSSGIVSAAKVVAVSWDTKHAAKPAKLPNNKQELLPLIRFGISTFPEPMVMQLTFIGGSTLGLSDKKAMRLHSLLTESYKLISNDPVFSSAPSALAYSYSAKKPTKGLATVYIPDNANEETPVILFLHGYGGSFLFYLHYLASTFPDHIIICPAFGISSAFISSAYLQECLDAVSEKLNFSLQRPVLMGISAGGRGGFREYTRQPNRYLGYICLAAFPPQNILATSPRNGRIRLIAGANEFFVTGGTLKKQEKYLWRRTRDYSSYLVPGEDHFFMISSKEETSKKLKEWVSYLESE